MKVKPWHRIVATASAVVLVGVLTGAVRLLQSHGAFVTVKPGFAGVCRGIASPTGPEDIAIDTKDGLAFISATDRPARSKAHPSPADGLYTYAYGAPGAALIKLAGTPGDFHPLGISLYRSPEGGLTLMAINHRLDGANTIDIFTVDVTNGAARLTEVGSIAGGVLISPNALAAIDEDRFYVVNDHTSKTTLGRWLDDNLVLPRANVLYFDGVKFRVVAKGLNFPSGAALSPDERFLYVSQSYPRTLVTYERQPVSGKLQQVSSLAIPSNLDNARLAPDGSIWLGSHPDAFAMAKYRIDPSKPAPSEIFHVLLKDGIPDSAKLVYADKGSQIGASSVGAVADGHLLIGSPFDNKILNCKLP